MYGHTVGAAIGLGYVESEEGVDRAFVEAGNYQIEVAGVRHAARASLVPLHDPKGARIRA
jgi:4-methylaminobutanoate oxidase (formaldehyde-forming)